jgi:multidrug resistance efflux pump
MRDELRSIDIDFNKRIALIEFLLFRYKQSIEAFVSRPQGSQEEIDIAQRALDEAKAALEEAQEALRLSEEAARDAKEKEEDAKK